MRTKKTTTAWTQLKTALCRTEKQHVQSETSQRIYHICSRSTISNTSTRHISPLLGKRRPWRGQDAVLQNIHTATAYIAVKGCLLTLRSLASQWRWSGRCHYHRTDRTPLVLSSTKSCLRGTFFSLFFSFDLSSGAHEIVPRALVKTLVRIAKQDCDVVNRPPVRHGSIFECTAGIIRRLSHTPGMLKV